MPIISTTTRIIFGVIATIGGAVFAILSNELGKNIIYFLTRIGRPPTTRKTHIWVIWFISFIFSLIFGSLAAYAPAYEAEVTIATSTQEPPLMSFEQLKVSGAYVHIATVSSGIEKLNPGDNVPITVLIDYNLPGPALQAAIRLEYLEKVTSFPTWQSIQQQAAKVGVNQIQLAGPIVVPETLALNGEPFQIAVSLIILDEGTGQIRAVVEDKYILNVAYPTESPAASPIIEETPSLNQNENLICSENILSHPWRLEASGMAAEDSKDFSDQYILKNMDIVRVSYNLHGLMAQEGERKNDSALVFNQPNWFGVNLSNYGENGLDGIQSVDIPIIDFMELPDPERGILGGRHLDLTEPISSIRARFWHRDYFLVEIIEINFCRFP